MLYGWQYSYYVQLENFNDQLNSNMPQRLATVVSYNYVETFG